MFFSGEDFPASILTSSSSPSPAEAWTYMAENDSVYKKNYHLKWSTLLGQPVSYYDVILAFIYYFIFLHFSFRLCAHKEGTGDDHSWPDPASFAATQTPVMILIFLYFISPHILHLFYNFYCSNMCVYGCLRESL